MAKVRRYLSFARSTELLAQAAIDLEDARCAELSKGRRFECAYDAALRAADSVLGETYTQTHGDLAAFYALGGRIRLESRSDALFMARLRQIEDRRRYEYLTSINETDVARAIAWADSLRAGAIQHLKRQAKRS